MALWEWAAAGAVLVAVTIFSVRLMKRGLTSLEEDRAEGLARMRQVEEKILEDQKNMPSAEHVHIVRAGVEDLVRLAGSPSDIRLEGVNPGMGEAGGEALLLHLPGNTVRISLSMRERPLRGVRKVAHGRRIWHLRDRDGHEDYADLVLLMRALSARLAACVEGVEATERGLLCPLGEPSAGVKPELPHLARRFAGAQVAPRPRRPTARGNGHRAGGNPGPADGQHR